MNSLPPLECLRFFEAAARHESFTQAAKELNVTSAAVAYRIKVLEEFLDSPLFDRRHRGVRLNTHGKIYLKDVQSIVAEIHKVTEHHRNRSRTRRLRIVSVEAVAEKWLMPRLADLKAAYPRITVELETDHRNVDPERRDFDVWIAYSGEARAPRGASLRSEPLLEETLFEETLFPVISPALVEARGKPRKPLDLHAWPLLYDLGWDTDWSYWFSRQGVPSPDLSQASGFRLYSMLIHAAVEGIGVAIGRPTLIARELEQGLLIPVFDRQVKAPARCCLITTAASAHNSEVTQFREWILTQAKPLRRRQGRRAAAFPPARAP